MYDCFVLQVDILGFSLDKIVHPEDHDILASQVTDNPAGGAKKASTSNVSGE